MCIFNEENYKGVKVVSANDNAKIIEKIHCSNHDEEIETTSIIDVRLFLLCFTIGEEIETTSIVDVRLFFY
uniref:Uncharacterized protein n=1 Tax=Solanum tuberosum TaxID=4113 RepID=M1CM37_SOLTU